MKPPPLLLIENKSRNNTLDDVSYNPTTGQGSFIPRKKVTIRYKSDSVETYLPLEAFQDPVISIILKHSGNIHITAKHVKLTDQEVLAAYVNARYKYDFEFWAISTVIIQDKETKEDIHFRLRKAQRLLLSKLEEMRRANIPIRIILLKARQWGGSTLVQIYMAWIQIIHKQNWHTAIVAQVEDQAKGLRGMYTRLAKKYPKELGSITLKPYEGSSKNRIVVEHGGILSIGSAEKPDTIRSQDLAMLHLSEVGLWGQTAKKGADDLAQSLRGALTDVPYSLCVMESTAKGVGNFFHREWQKAEKQESNYQPVFIAWYEIEIYRHTTEQIEQDYGSVTAFIKSWDNYEKWLWEQGATVEGIAWYRWKLRDMGGDKWRMQAEYPSSAQEAFQSTGERIFAPAYIANLRQTIKAPIAIGNLIGDAHRGPESLKNIRFEEQKEGKLWIWRFPDELDYGNVRHQTCGFADVGGRTDSADKSTMTILDRYWMMEGGVPEVVAEYRGNLDQDIAAWDFARIAKWYHNALLAVESNSLRSEKSDEGDHSLTVLDQIKEHYDNLFHRVSPEKHAQGGNFNYPGFHTNRATKEMIINELNAAARDKAYIERSERACSEMDTYERKSDGRMGAVEGAKDDLVISRAGSVWLALQYMPIPEIINLKVNSKKRRKGYADI